MADDEYEKPFDAIRSKFMESQGDKQSSVGKQPATKVSRALGRFGSSHTYTELDSESPYMNVEDLDIGASDDGKLIKALQTKLQAVATNQEKLRQEYQKNQADMMEQINQLKNTNVVLQDLLTKTLSSLQNMSSKQLEIADTIGQQISTLGHSMRSEIRAGRNPGYGSGSDISTGSDSKKVAKRGSKSHLPDF